MRAVWSESSGKSPWKQESFGEATAILFGRNNNYFVVFPGKTVIVTRFNDSEYSIVCCKKNCNPSVTLCPLQRDFAALHLKS